MAGVDREPVGDIEHRVRVRAGCLPSVQPKRRPRVRPSRRNAAPAAPSGPVTTTWSPGIAPARPGTRSERPIAVTLSMTLPALEGIAAEDGTPVSAIPCRLDDIFDLHVARSGERDEEALGVCSRGGEVAEVDRRRAPAEVAPRDPVEPKVDALDERVLRDDHACAERCGVVLDPLRKTATLELGEQSELARLRELHRSPCAGRRHRGQPG